MNHPIHSLSLLALMIGTVTSCCTNMPNISPEYDLSSIDYKLTQSTAIIVTSEAGDKLVNHENVLFNTAQPTSTVVLIRPDIIKQTMTGVGTSFTESSAFVLAHLDKTTRQEVMHKIYSEQGANFSLARTHIGASDFAVEGKYSYAPIAGDIALKNFSIAVDKEGFSKTKYPGIIDESYDLLPMIKEANLIKFNQQDKPISIVASAWTAPDWMKDIEDWYIKGNDDTGFQGTGGKLKPQYVEAYADYLIKYLDAYQFEGIHIWGLTPVNEPHGNNGQWESMHFTPETQQVFIRDYLGPNLLEANHGNIKLLIYDQNRDGMEHWTDVILGDDETAKYVYGTAIHWYESTTEVSEDILDKVHKKFPNFDIIHTEGTIDDLGKPAGGGILDPIAFQEKDWFDNDAFWWNENATDWAYSATWAEKPEDHPIYTPVHRYARNIIVSFNHWMSGWIDWNIVLDHQGGPNHVGNFCGAPIMIDTNTGQVYYTPIYYVLAQFSRTIRPGDKAVQATKYLDGLANDDLHASATINENNLLSVQLLNTTKSPLTFKLQIGIQNANVTIPANAVQTVQVQL